MPDILVRGLDEETLRRLKERARRHGRSLQGEAKLLLEQAAGTDPEELAAMLQGWKERFAGRQMADSAAIISEDRDR